MFNTDEAGKTEELIDDLKLLNKEYIEAREINSKAIGIYNLLINLKRVNFKYFVNFIRRNLKRRKIISSGLMNSKNEIIDSNSVNIYNENRFVVYTVIFGKYDRILEPVFVPDNCDFYIVTDNELPAYTKWKKYDLSKCMDLIKNFDNIEKNRYLKMHPEKLFPDYQYSIYIDGNIQPISDLTELVNKISPYGVSMHFHNHRNCVYKEIEVLKILKKDKKTNLDYHKEHLLNEEMPYNYGMLECNVIVRKHNDYLCQKLMDEWWHEFTNYSRRDQVSFPYVLYKNNIDVKEIATLGYDVRKNFCLRVYEHL